MAEVLENVIVRSNSIKRTTAAMLDFILRFLAVAESKQVSLCSFGLTKTFVVLCSFFFSVSTNAQTFMEHLQQSKAGEGTVTVIQSKEIDRLVNGNETTPPKLAHTDTQKHKSTKTSSSKGKPAKTITDEGHDTIAIDNSKKLLANATKVDGYRVQVYAGGNSRADKQRAQQIGAEVKALFPELPVYVHFYSPRWICRAGNFRSNEEAVKVLQELRRQGYSEASIIKGKITVQH